MAGSTEFRPLYVTLVSGSEYDAKLLEVGDGTSPTTDDTPQGVIVVNDTADLPSTGGGGVGERVPWHQALWDQHSSAEHHEWFYWDRNRSGGAWLSFRTREVDFYVPTGGGPLAATGAVFDVLAGTCSATLGYFAGATENWIAVAAQRVSGNSETGSGSFGVRHLIDGTGSGSALLMGAWNTTTFDKQDVQIENWVAGTVLGLETLGSCTWPDNSVVRMTYRRILL